MRLRAWVVLTKSAELSKHNGQVDASLNTITQQISSEICLDKMCDFSRTMPGCQR